MLEFSFRKVERESEGTLLTIIFLTGIGAALRHNFRDRLVTFSFANVDEIFTARFVETSAPRNPGI